MGLVERIRIEWESSAKNVDYVIDLAEERATKDDMDRYRVQGHKPGALHELMFSLYCLRHPLKIKKAEKYAESKLKSS